MERYVLAGTVRFDGQSKWIYLRLDKSESIEIVHGSLELTRDWKERMLEKYPGCNKQMWSLA